MPGYNPDVINPGGIDYVEVNNLVNPPNVSNKGKVVGIGDDGRATLIDGGGGGGLPEVTSDDNGDVLTVVEGAWAKAEPHGDEAVVLYIVGAPDTDPETEKYTDVEEWHIPEYPDVDVAGLSRTIDGEALTYSEIVDLISSKATVVISATDGHMLLYPGYALYGEEGGQTPYIKAYYSDGDTNTTYMFGVLLDGTGK